MQDKLALLLAALANIAPKEDPLAELQATLGSGPLSLAAILDARETLQANADRTLCPGRPHFPASRALCAPVALTTLWRATGF
jgi:hypothetical protein